ncbi:hypothetical protein [Mesorhizobium sp. SARCC-RB16n]|uniref:hypothetical protein n=1 Tax=Mesorhizobium sp. SARCC-RB16n TaxID=2116687 RepID=UPI00166B4C19|nr:hypothetical protein [Mesorhizobium sp. SARCC-RB16n]
MALGAGQKRTIICTTTLLQGDEGVYGGKYKLAVYDSTADKDSDGKAVDLTGKVSCGAE